MSRRTAIVGALLALLGMKSAGAQEPFPLDLLPTRTALARLGLERQWMAVVPLVNDERLTLISLAGDFLFAQTNRANFHAFEAESGRLLWSANLGRDTARPQPASVNSFAVFVTSMNRLFALDRRTGRQFWSQELGDLPASATACDEDRVMVGLANGKVYAYELKVKEAKRTYISSRPVEAWNWQTSGITRTRPLLTPKLAAFASEDGKVYVSLAEERTMLYRIATGGAVGRGLGTSGTRLLLVPSADNNLYGVDILTASVLWTFPSGSPISQGPVAADEEIFVVNDGGLLSSIDPATGSPRWTVSTEGGRLVSISEKRVYLESATEDLFLVDRASGRIIAGPRATHERAGLNIRDYSLGFPNSLNDRIYLGTPSGMVVALREQGQLLPRPLRDPKGKPFGYIPPEGLSTTPPLPPPADDPATPPAEGAAGAPEGEKASDLTTPPGDAK